MIKEFVHTAINGPLSDFQILVILNRIVKHILLKSFSKQKYLLLLINLIRVALLGYTIEEDLAF
jgi:hypothetical protein